MTALSPEDEEDGTEEASEHLISLDELAPIAARVAAGRDEFESLRETLRWLRAQHPGLGLTDEDLRRLDGGLTALDRHAARSANLLISANEMRRNLATDLPRDATTGWWLRRLECPADVLGAEPWSEAARAHAVACGECARDLRRRAAITALLDHRGLAATEDAARADRQVAELVAQLEPPPSSNLRALWVATTGADTGLDAMLATTISEAFTPTVALAAGSEAGLAIRGMIGDRHGRGRLFVDDEQVTRDTLFTLEIEAHRPTSESPVRLLLGKQPFAAGTFDAMGIANLHLVPTVADRLSGSERFVSAAELVMLEFAVP
jgi:hypothetical protein